MSDDVFHMDLQDYLDNFAKKQAKPGKDVDLESVLSSAIRLAGLPEPETQHKFHDKRRWRFDFAWPDRMLAAEVNGGTWVNGRHNRGSSVPKEYEKLNHAVLAGWQVLLFTSDMVNDGTAVQYLIDYFDSAR